MPPQNFTGRTAVTTGEHQCRMLNKAKTSHPPACTARIEQAPFHRARSASKKGTWPLPPMLADFFGILLNQSISKGEVWLKPLMSMPTNFS